MGAIVESVPVGMDVTAIAGEGWLVRISALPEGNPLALLGFVASVGNSFEVTPMGDPRERGYFDSFDDAVASLRPTDAQLAGIAASPGGLVAR